MKLLHTSDWHLGHELYGINRRDEFAAMLLNIKKIIKQHSPDAMVIAGDIFDTSTPPIEAQTLYANALVEFHRLRPEMIIIATSGNHDSANRHEIFRHPWRAHNVHSIGTIDPANPAANIIEIPGKGYVCAVPFVNERLIPDRYFQRLVDEVPDNNLPIVLTAHTAVVGADFAGHKRMETEAAEYIGNIKTTDITALANGFDYLALGHIHTPQFIHGAGHHRVRYCGSPLPVGFDEATVAHGVTIVEIAERGAEPVVEPIEIQPLRKLVTLPDPDNFLSWEAMLKLLTAYKASGPQLLRLNIIADSPLPDNRRQLIADALGEQNIVVCTLNVHRPGAGSVQGVKVRSVSEFQAENPLTIAQEYAEYAGIPMTDDMVNLFREVLTEINL